ncbi:MAG: alpha/beta hydrolase, partial [Saprospiraceae bacterium]|nr:alpha/beta hydrolase [Saprospiraceae bacterium]
MKNPINFLYTFIIIILFITSSVRGQEVNSINLGERHTIYSKVLDEDRPYLIYLPEDYNTNGQSLAVMYLLDGGGHFHHTTGIVSFLRNQGIIPHMMVVGIPNTDDRTKDLTPVITEDTSAMTGFPTAGGADKMLEFLKDELIPKINADYNTNNYKLLVGHSFGGIFSLNALLKEPALFDSHISISPSMWWDNQHLVDRAEKFLKMQDSLDVYYYMTMGNEGGNMLGGAMKL